MEPKKWTAGSLWAICFNHPHTSTHSLVGNWRRKQLQQLQSTDWTRDGVKGERSIKGLEMAIPVDHQDRCPGEDAEAHIAL